MSHVRHLMARSRLTWLLWMTLGSLLLIPLVLLDLALDTARAMRAEWHWHYRDELTRFIGFFGERHRNALRSLGQKPLP